MWSKSMFGRRGGVVATELIAIAVTTITFIAIGGCLGAPPEDDGLHCERVREHLIDLRLADTTNVNRDTHRVAMRAALGEEFVATCRASLSESQRSCVLRATDGASATACARGGTL